MVAVAAAQVSAGLWISATHFAVDSTNSRPTRPIFQTIGLVLAEGFETRGR